MSFQETLSKHKETIDKRIAEFFADKEVEFTQSFPEAVLLLKYLKNFTLGGGKRLRSLLALIAYQGLGGRKRIQEVLVSLELLHSYLLIHDDIMDQEITRHNQKTLWANYYFESLKKHIPDKLKRLHNSQSLALLAGNILNSFIFMPILKSSFSFDVKLNLITLLEKNQVKTGFGQLMDIYSSFTFPSAAKVLKIYYLKTSIYSFETPLLFGAELSGKNSLGLEKQIADFAKPLGLAFQLRDDVLGVFGDFEITGKSTLTDLLQKKKTFLVLKTIALLKNKNKKDFLKLFQNKNLNAQETSILKELIVSSGSLELVQKKTAFCVIEAQKALKNLPFEAKQKELLELFVDFAALRSK